MKGGSCDSKGLNDRYKREIQGNISKKVLMTDRHPQAIFEGKRVETEDGFKVDGTLELKGKRVPIAFDLHLEESHLKGKVELTQSRWGIKPFRAMGGAIKLKDTLRIEFSLET
jgi:polyisoprenoid-binding protein YceI